jgi:glycosyltransferase involved in cell wall biosynthesis
MKYNPLVSVIISNYNYERFLSVCINNVLNQTYKNLEIIVVDDGSTDGSREIIAAYKQQLIVVLKKNEGQLSAFKAGFERSRGEIVCFLDSDDFWMPQKVGHVVEAASTNTAAILIYHRIQKVDADAKPLGPPIPRVLLQGKIADLVARSGGYWGYPPTSALAFRREYLDTALGLISSHLEALRTNGAIPEENARLCADAYLTDLAPFLGEVIGLKHVLTAYRQHGSNYWNHSRRQQGDPDCVRLHLRFYETRLRLLKQNLSALGISASIDLKDHWPYQRIKRKLGTAGGLSLPALSWKALQLPFLPSFIDRLKLLVRLWCDRTVS